MFSKLDEFLDGFVGHGTPGYDFIVYKDGECVYRRMNGYSDIENKIKMRGDELYYIYSCSKVMTCTAALQLYERGYYKLDDKLSKYMPEFAVMRVKCDGGTRIAERDIRIEDLFCMTAGLSYRVKSSPVIDKFKSETDGLCPTSEFAKYISEAPLDFEPGDMWQYSFCHDILAALVERLSGMHFGEYVKKNIFDPLGMTRSTFCIKDVNLDELCTQYMYDSATQSLKLYGPTNVYCLGSEYESGGAGCVTTLEDCIKFAEGLRTEKLLSADTLDLMTINRIAGREGNYWAVGYGYGLGVKCSKEEGDGISDFGWGGAAGAGIWIDRANGISMYYAQHVLSSPVAAEKNKLIFMVRDILGCSPASEKLTSSGSGNSAMSAKYGV